MKTVKVLVAAMLATFAVEAKAQLVNVTDDYTRAEVSFNAQSLRFVDDDDDDPFKSKGFALGFVKGINLTSNMPLFLELGGRLAWNHGKEKETIPTLDVNGKEILGLGVKHEYKQTFMNIAIPVNVAYKFAFSSSQITIAPFLGPNFKFNIIGKYKEEIDGDKELDLSYFDDDDFKETAKRFQFGLNIGVGVNINSFYVGYTFQPDLSSYVKYDSDDKLKTRNQFVTIGLNF